MQDQQETCVRTLRIDPPLCDECHRAIGVQFVVGQWLCPICRHEILARESLNVR